ncbi:MAG: PKD domain-containing protein, partial [Bacteroidota bacterium]
ISGQQGQDWMLVSGNLFNAGQIGVKFMEPGTYTIEMTVVSFACGEFTFTQEVTIYDPPEAVGGVDLSVLGNIGDGACLPVEIPLDASGSMGADAFSWEIAQENGWEVAAGNTLDSAATVISFTEGGTYDLSLAVGNACTTVNWDTTILIPGPPTIELAPLPDQCEMATLNFDASLLSIAENGSPVESYIWSFAGATPSTSNEQYPSNIQYDEAGEYIVTLTTINACGSNTISDTFMVQAIVPLELPTVPTVCDSDAAFQLNASPAGGSWSGPGVSPQGMFMPNYAQAGNNVLTYTYGVAACLMQDTVQVEVLVAPEVNAGPDQTLCSNAPDIDLSGLPPGGEWTGMDSTWLNGSNFSPSLAGPGTYNLTYSVIGANQCAGTDDLNVIVLPIPDVVVTPTSFCDIPGEVFLPQATPANGAWSGQGVVDSSGKFSPNAAGGPGIYPLIYSVEGTNGCVAEELVDIGVISPELVDAGPDTTLCGAIQGYDLAEVATPPGGTWLFDGIPMDSNVLYPMLSNPGTYPLVYRIGAGSCEVRDTVELAILEVEQAQAGPGETFCLNENSTHLQGFSPAGGTWEGPGITDANAGIFDPSSLPAGMYSLNYTIIDPTNGCPNTAEKSVVIHPLPEAAFSSPPSVCTNQPLSVINQSEDAAVFEWAFGDGQQSAVANPIISYPDTGYYDIQLTVYNIFGCKAIADQGVQVKGPPTALFTPSVNEHCGSTDIGFENHSTGDTPSFSWDFGNGTTFEGEVPPDSVLYPESSEDQHYTVSLQATNSCGTTEWTDSILIRAFPEAQFGFTVDTGCAPLIIHFSNISSGSLDQYWWDFGNGQTAMDSLPAPQTYTAPDSTQAFPVTLIVGNACGADTLTQEVVVEPEQVEAFLNISNTLGCAPFTVDLASYATPGTQVSWDFGDGNVSNQAQASYTFEEPGEYVITQHAWNSCDEDSTSIMIEVQAAPQLDFEVSPNLCDQQTIQFTIEGTGIAQANWYFGNGDSTEVTNPTYSFQEPGTYLVRVEGTGLGTGCTASVERPITIAPAPTVEVDVDDNQGCPPLVVTFSESEPNTSLYHLWDFGDGSSTVEASPQHIFTDPGDYEPTLTVTDERGCFTVVSPGQVFVYPIPTAAFAIQKDKDCGLPMGLQFADQSEGADALIWQNTSGWTSNQQEPMYTVYEAGDWVTTQIAQNTFGCRDTVSQTLAIYGQPAAEFDLSEYEGCAPLQVTFSNYSQGNRFMWLFGDGSTSEFATPSHEYTQAGNYQVGLVAAYDSLCFDTLRMAAPIQVFAQPIASFDWEAELLNNQPTGLIQFTNTSRDAERYFWDFGDTHTSEEVSPSHRYTENNQWKVQLTAWSEGNCTHDTLLYFSPGVIKGLHLPNAFSPDLGIGETKYFFPKGIGLKEYHIQIYSTYGQLLWESNELVNGEPAEGWDGTLNGAPLPQDVYVWKVRAIFDDETHWKGVKKEGSYKRVGSVTLLR